jgi:hypothetical protein
MSESAENWAWLRNRWVIVPALLTALALGWWAYAEANNDGLIEGRVVDAAGAPVPGASVVLFERGFVAHQEKTRVTADGQGRFRITGNSSHSVQLEAEAPGLGRSNRLVLRLWFRAQNRVLAEPLRFAQKCAGG